MVPKLGWVDIGVAAPSPTLTHSHGRKKKYKKKKNERKRKRHEDLTLFSNHAPPRAAQVTSGRVQQRGRERKSDRDRATAASRRQFFTVRHRKNGF